MSETMREVVLIDFPLRTVRRAYQHRESLLREFAIIVHSSGEESDVPKRLIEIATELDARYAGLNPEGAEAASVAWKQGKEYIDLHLSVPTRIKDDTLDLAPLLLEVDEYCRTGRMLTLPPSNEIREFWVWFLLEFVQQAKGEPPTPWRSRPSYDFLP